MAGRSKTPTHRLPQEDETWHVYIHKMRTWIAPPDEESYRPYAFFVLNPTRQMIQTVELEEEIPTTEDALELLLDTIHNPKKEISQKPYRPAEIHFEDETLSNALTGPLDEMGIKARLVPHLDVVDDIIADLEDHMSGGAAIPGLLSVRGVTPKLVGGLFSAAAALYRAQLWNNLSDEHTFAITVPPEKRARYLKVMGHAGIEYGLATYKRWKDVERMYQAADDPFDALPEDGGHSFLFNDITMTPFGDLEAIEQYGWEVENEEAYPVPIIFPRDEDVKRPSKKDLIWYEAALLALIKFVKEHMRAKGMDEFHDAEATIPVETHAGEVQVHVKYPGGIIPKELRPASQMEWGGFEDDDDAEMPAMFDRRAMEGSMRMFGGGFDDPALNEAQDLMYQAWDETNPARRIILAHQALSVSPNCADAYVLLAEEEADTVARALKFYKEGMDAGAQALGEEFFEENVGHFWGLLETRPYMRAREGYARLLWQVDRKEEAAEHYREMLRLNPGDNQGHRYVLANLLLSLNLDDEVIALLDEYHDDSMSDFLFTRALMEFRRGGASDDANSALRKALEQNSHVPAYLTGRKHMPTRLPDRVIWGGETEAMHYAAQYLQHWRHTRGALDWLKSQTGEGKKEKRKRRTKRGRRGSSKR